MIDEDDSNNDDDLNKNILDLLSHGSSSSSSSNHNNNITNTSKRNGRKKVTFSQAAIVKKNNGKEHQTIPSSSFSSSIGNTNKDKFLDRKSIYSDDNFMKEKVNGQSNTNTNTTTNLLVRNDEKDIHVLPSFSRAKGGKNLTGVDDMNSLFDTTTNDDK